MRMMTKSELTGRSDCELAVLFHMVSKALAVTKGGTPERRAVISNLQNINAAQRQRHAKMAAPGL